MAVEWFNGVGKAILAFGTAFLVTFILTPVVRLAAVRLGWVTRPVEDRWGRRMIARLGGAGMFAGVMVSALLWLPHERTVVGLLLGVTLVFGLGLLDDLRRIPPYTKLVGQLLIGSVVVISGIRISLVPWEWLAVPVSILWFVLVMNAFNLLDNMDGLAAGIGAIAAGFCAVHAGLANQWTIASLAAMMSGVCLGFLRYNFPPAKIFMGDSGSHLLGLSLAALALMGSWRHSTQLLSVLAVPMLVLAVPIFDTCFVTIQRLIHRQHPFVGGRDHVFHRLVVLGLSVRQTVTVLYIISACLGFLSLVSASLKPLSMMAIWLSVITGFVLLGRYLTKVNVYRLEPRISTDTAVDVPRASTQIETMLLHKRRLLEILADFCVISSAYVFAHLLRFEGVLTGDLQQLIIRSLPIILVMKLTCFAIYRLYRGVWRYLGLSDLITVFKAVTLGSILSSLALLYFWRFEGYSRAVLIIDWLLTFMGVASSRVVERLFDIWICNAVTTGVPALIVGAGDTGARVLRAIKYETRASHRVVGLLDDDLRKLGDRIYGAPVLGTRTQLPELLEREGVREVLVAIADPPGELLEYIRQCCEPKGVAWKVVTAGVTDAV